MASQLKPNWAQRYLAIVLPALLLLAPWARSAARFPAWSPSSSSCSSGFNPSVVFLGDRPALDPESQSPDRRLARVIRPHLAPGDVVIAIQMEEVPVLRYYLGPRFRFADPSGPVRDPQLVDWRDAMERMEQSSPEVGLAPLLEALRSTAGSFWSARGTPSPRM